MRALGLVRSSCSTSLAIVVLANLVLTIVVLATSVTDARAQESEAEVRRLRDIESTLDAEEAPSRRWYWGWLGGYAAATTAQTVFAFALHDDALRAGSRVGAVKSGLGMVALLVFPLSTAFSPSRLRAMPETTVTDRHAKARAAEIALREAADDQRFGRSFIPHAAAVVVNAAGSIYLWRHDDLPVPAIESFLLGMIVAEIQIFTRPTGARDFVDRGVAVSLAPLPGGLALIGSF